MDPPATHQDLAEAQRVASVHALQLLDSLAEAPFDDLVRAAALLCGTPMAMFSVVDADRVWFKSALGLSETREVEREKSFCSWTIRDAGLFEVGDATQDPRFCTAGLVTGAPCVRFYSGVPVTLPDGQRVGALAVLDVVPRTLTPAQRQGLESLGRSVASSLHLRSSLRDALLAQQLANIVQHSDDAVIGKSLESTIISWNEGAERLFGYSREEVLGRPIAMLFPPDRQEEAERLALRVRAGTTVRQLETVRRHKDGHLIDVSVTLSPIRDRSGTVIGVAKIARDIGHQKADERALSQSEARYRALIEDQSELVSLATPDGQLTFVNGAYARHFGRTRESMIGASLYDFIPQEEHAAVKAHLARVCETRQQASGENRMYSADGAEKWLAWTNVALTDESDEVIAIHSVGRDVTERRRVEQDLRTARVDLQAVMDHSPVQISAWTTDWTNRFANPAYAAWWGTTPQALLGRHVRDVIGPEAYERSWSAIHGVSEGRSQSFERSSPGPDGRLRHAIVEYVPDMRDGRYAGAFVFVTEVTERMRDRQEIARQNELLRVTLASIGEGVITCDARGQVSWMNAVAERLTGWTSAEAGGKALGKVFQVIHADSRAAATDPVVRCLELGAPVALEPDSVLVARDGNEYGVEDSAAPIRNAEGDVLGAVLVFRDVSEQRRLSGEMRYRAAHDALTGAYNRSEFDLRMADLLARVRTRGGVHALLYADLDRFKAVNDRCGHEAGDRLLYQVARLLGEGIRSRDVLARLGGDEFAILLEDCSPQQGQRIAGAILERLAGFRFVQDEVSFEIGASIGLVSIDSNSPGAATLLRQADQACYGAKAAGRNRVEVWQDRAIP